jgi:hypothetical protein
MSIKEENQDQPMLFDDRFLEKYAGYKILKDPVTAIIELIANAWDAGATEVHILWPEDKNDVFSISDNGCGISENEFKRIWSTLYYDRTKDYGKDAVDNGLPIKRTAFGRNGIGRCAGFCFGEYYNIISKDKDGNSINYNVLSKDNGRPFTLVKNNTGKMLNTHGTKIVVKNPRTHGKGVDDIASEIGMRFFSDEYFKIYLQNKLISFEDIDPAHVKERTLKIDNEEIIVKIIDTHDTDRTAKHHGIAWRVNNRLVGEISWDGISNKYNVDGRRIESRRYSFIVVVNFLDKYILADWSGFEKDNPIVDKISEEVYKFIWKILIDLGKGQREESFNNIKTSLKPQIQKMSPLKREEWEKFIKTTQEQCPSLSENELSTIGSVLANLELSGNKYDLLNQLTELSPGQLDDLDNILKSWNIDYAKILLDELENRLKLLKQLNDKLYSKKADEVKELQPLFERGLWIFGPEYESIEYTSNKGMTTVIQELFGDDSKGSANRPDFVIRPDSSVGLYSRFGYDDEGSETGVEKLVIIELKAPGVSIKDDEMNQPMKYARELFSKGFLNDKISTVVCFVVGESIAREIKGDAAFDNGAVIIKPIIYDTVIRRAKSRLFNLYDKLKGAPFMKAIDRTYTQAIEDMRQDLL